MRLSPFLPLATATLFPAAVFANQVRTAASTLSPASASSASSFPTSPTSSFSSSPTSVAGAPALTTLDGEEPQITEPPEVLNGDVNQQFQEKYHMTTYWSCVTIATQVHCGWHEPVLPGGDEIAAASGTKHGGLRWVMGLAVAVVGLVMK